MSDSIFRYGQHWHRDPWRRTFQSSARKNEENKSKLVFILFTWNQCKFELKTGLKIRFVRVYVNRAYRLENDGDRHEDRRIHEKYIRMTYTQTAYRHTHPAELATNTNESDAAATQLAAARTSQADHACSAHSYIECDGKNKKTI